VNKAGERGEGKGFQILNFFSNFLSQVFFPNFFFNFTNFLFDILFVCFALEQRYSKVRDQQPS
jgi:hypothetical protein